MAPSSRAARTSNKISTSLAAPIKTSSFGRVSKTSRLNVLHVKSSTSQKENLLEVIEQQQQTRQEKIRVSKQEHAVVHQDASKRSVKRKMEDITSDSDDERVLRQKSTARKYLSLKKPKLQQQLLTPPGSRHGTDSEAASPIEKSPCQSDELLEPLRDLTSLHAAFLKALNLHYAHNGPSTPAELTNLMASMTQIWKKSTVSQEMVQQMLALHEVVTEVKMAGPRTAIDHKNGPFKLVASGLGASRRTNVEFVGAENFHERNLQLRYEKAVRSVFNEFKANGDAFVHGSMIGFPQLVIALGHQTQARQAKAAGTRSEILQLSNSAQLRGLPNFARLSIDSASQPDLMSSTPTSTKSRTQSLFDRVRAKGLALSANAAPTSEQILRRHAVGRIAEVVDFIRMKQQRKCSAQFLSSEIDVSPDQIVKGKVSFSLAAIVNEIRQSAGVPIGDEEVRCCIRILSQEVPQWLSCLDMGSVRSVTLVGSGLSGVVVKKMIEDKERLQ